MRPIRCVCIVVALGVIAASSAAIAQSVDEANRLAQQARQYLDRGRFSEAEPLYRRALAIRERALGPDNPDNAIALNNLALTYRFMGRFPEAEQLYKRSLAIRERTRGPDHPDVALLLNNLADVYRYQQRFSEAEPLFKRALAIREKAFGPNNADVALSISQIAGTYRNMGRYSEAEPLFLQSLSILEKARGPDHVNVTEPVNGLADLYYATGRYAEAEPLYKRALAIHEKTHGRQHQEVARSLNNLALLYDATGRYADSEPLYKRSLAIAEAVHGSDHTEVGTLLNNIALFYATQRRFAESEPIYKRAIAVRERALGPEHSNVAQSIGNLALQYVQQTRYTEAEPLYKRALAIREKALGPDHPDVALTAFNLAELYRLQERYRAAEPLFQRALAIREKALGPGNPDFANSQFGLGVFYRDLGRFADAEPLLKNSLAISEKTFGPDHPRVGRTVNELALLHGDQERPADALAMIERAVASRQATRRIFPAIQAVERAKIIDANRSFDESFAVLQLTSSSAAAEAVTKLAQRHAAGTGELATLVRRDQDLAGEIDRKDKALLEALSKASKERDASAEAAMRDRLIEIQAERDRIQSSLNSKFPEYSALAKPQPLSLAETQKLLDDDEAVIAFDIGPEKSYVWAVTRTDHAWGEIDAASDDMNRQIKELRQSITTEGVDFNAALAHDLYKRTFAPVASWLAGKKRLSIVANGALTSIPFGLLIATDPAGKSAKDIDWLIRSHAITVIPSVYSLKTMRIQFGQSNAPKTMTAFADPVFSQAARAQAQPKPGSLRSLPSLYRGTQIDVAALAERLPQLAGTRKEVETIARALGVDPADIKLGLEATEGSVKQAKLDQYKIVYFATHGLVSGDLAQFSKSNAEPSLAFTIPAKPNDVDDGLLQASEVAQLKLNADWVVLSACNTASSDGVGAEALSGLARAFLYAGGRSLVVSHWEVDDEATSALMASLFEIASKNPSLSHGQAMQQAMLKLIDDAKTPAEAHPRLWAPFVVVGEPKKGG